VSREEAEEVERGIFGVNDGDPSWLVDEVVDAVADVLDWVRRFGAERAFQLRRLKLKDLGLRVM